ncbi:hypothetical protein JCM18899A_53230 [Nocardioides sp. AN3]
MTVSTPSVASAPSVDAPHQRAWRIAAWTAVIAAVLAHLWVERSSFAAGTPSFNFDEVQSLMPGRALLGYPTPQVGGSGYFPLPTILVAPVWWLTSDPVAFYRAALLISLAAGLASIWPLSRVATRFGLSTAQAVTVAGVLMTLPAHTVQAEYALAEKPLLLVVALTALAAVRLTERPTYPRVLLLALGVALAYFTHARMITVVVAALVWLVAFTLRHVRIGLVGIVALLAFSWAARRIALHVVLLVSPGGFQQGDDFGSLVRHLRPGVLARTVTGQSWEQVVSTAGLASLGLVVVVSLAVRELRRLVAGPALLLVLAVGALFAGSAISMAKPSVLRPTTGLVRLDVWIYGRYVDPLFTLVMLVALAAIVVGVRRWQLWAGAAVTLVVCLVTVVWLGPDAPTGGFLTPAHAPGASAFWWALPHQRFWLIASLVALVPVVVLLVIPRRPLVVLGVVLALGLAGTASANVASGRFHDLRAQPRPLVGTLRQIVAEHPGTTISYFWRCPRHPAAQPALRNRYAWLLLPTVLGSDSGSDIVIACPGHPAAGRPGAVALSQPADRDYVAWVRPGPLQDELRSEGLLARR